MTNTASQPDYDFLHALADLARDAVMPLFRAPIAIENKEQAGFDPVTEADKQAELIMREAIVSRFPDHGIVGEEFEDQNLDAHGVWILDPIDGTRAFISGLPTWGTLIGYRHKDGCSLGMMSQAFTGERFFGNGKRSFYTGPDGARDLNTRSCGSLADATLFTTSPDLFVGDEIDAYFRVEKATRLARYGVDCYAYCMVALGYADLVVESSLKAVDIAPLIPIVEGAGGHVTNWQGGSAFDGGQVIASANKQIHEQALALLSGLCLKGVRSLFLAFGVSLDGAAWNKAVKGGPKLLPDDISFHQDFMSAACNAYGKGRAGICCKLLCQGCIDHDILRCGDNQCRGVNGRLHIT